MTDMYINSPEFTGKNMAMMGDILLKRNHEKLYELLQKHEISPWAVDWLVQFKENQMAIVTPHLDRRRKRHTKEWWQHLEDFQKETEQWFTELFAKQGFSVQFKELNDKKELSAISRTVEKWNQWEQSVKKIEATKASEVSYAEVTKAIS